VPQIKLLTIYATPFKISLAESWFGSIFENQRKTFRN